MLDLIQSVGLIALVAALIIRELRMRRTLRALDRRMLGMENEQRHVFNWQKRADPLLQRWLP